MIDEDYDRRGERLCMYDCVSVYVSLARDYSESINVIIIKLGTVTVSDMRNHHVLIILTLTFIQGHTNLSHENN